MDPGDWTATTEAALGEELEPTEVSISGGKFEHYVAIENDMWRRACEAFDTTVRELAKLPGKARGVDSQAWRVDVIARMRELRHVCGGGPGWTRDRPMGEPWSPALGERVARLRELLEASIHELRAMDQLASNQPEIPVAAKTAPKRRTSPYAKHESTARIMDELAKQFESRREMIENAEADGRDVPKFPKLTQTALAKGARLGGATVFRFLGPKGPQNRRRPIIALLSTTSGIELVHRSMLDLGTKSFQVWFEHGMRKNWESLKDTRVSGHSRAVDLVEDEAA